MIKPNDVKELKLIFKHNDIPLEVYQIDELSRTNEYYLDKYKTKLGFSGQLAVKNLIANHFGWHDIPWCCFSIFNNKNNLNFNQFKDSAHYFWAEYSLVPKCLAFYNNRLTAFKCISKSLYNDFIENKLDFTDASENYIIDETQDLIIDKDELNSLNKDEREKLFWKIVKPWWDRSNNAHTGIPFTTEIPNDQLKRTALFEYNEQNANIIQISDSILQKKHYNIHWAKDGTYKGIFHK